MPTILTIKLEPAIVFNLTGFAFDTSFGVNSQETAARGVAFNPDGTKMFIVGQGDVVYQYTLSSGFDLSTASFDSVSFDVSGQLSFPEGIAFSPDGTKMFIVGQGTDSVHQYTLSTGFDISTASFDSESFFASDTIPTGIAFNPDGTKMFVVGSGNDVVRQNTLSTGFDLSTASFDLSFSVTDQDISPRGLAFNSDGTKMFVIGQISSSVYQYSLSTGFDLSTASFDSESFSVASQDTGPEEVAFSPDETKMFVLGSSAIHQYSQ